MVLFAFSLAMFFLLDPSDTSWGLETNAFCKYLPVIVSLMAVPFFLLHLTPGKIQIEVRFLILFLCFMLFGSLISILILGNRLEDSFLGRFVCALVFFPAYFMCLSEADTEFFIKWAGRAVIVGGSMIGVQLLCWIYGFRYVDALHIYHEEIFIVSVAVGTLFFKMKKNLFFLGVLFFVFSMIISHKNTGYLCALFSVIFILRYLYWKLRTIQKIKKMLFFLFSIVAFFAVFSVILTVFLFFREYLPSGSPSVRLVTYLQRFTMFLESPIWGTFFIGTPLVDIGSLRIPSHSDILDILAFGGLGGGLLLFFPLVRVLLFFNRRIKVIFEKRDEAIIFSLFGVCTFLIEMLFNPVWGQPKIATIFWCCMGCLFAQFSIWRGNDQK